MHDTTRLLFVAGLGSTGSSAVCDLITGYRSVFCPSQEWRIWVDPDGLVDLARRLSYETSMFGQTTAIERFDTLVRRLTKPGFGPYSKLRLPEYVRDIYRQIVRDLHVKFDMDSYRGLWYGNSNHLFALANFKFRRIAWKSKPITKRMWLATMMEQDDSLRLIGSIVDNALEGYLQQQNADLFAVNENFSILYADSILTMHPNAKIVVTLRDPLDVYADSLRVGWLAMPYEIDRFVRWQNTMYQQVSRAKSRWPNRIHVVEFERLCTNYEKEIAALKVFIPGKLDHLEQQRFVPERSRKNIGQWKTRAPWLEKHRDRFTYVNGK
ncbi:MAG: sulfotransferase [Betaproteobacteria bacterium]